MTVSSTLSVRAMIVDHHPKVDHPAGEHLGHRRQPLTQGPAVEDLAHRPAAADVLRRRHLRSDLLGGIDARPIPRRQLHRPAGIQRPHRQQPLRGRGGFITRGLTDHLDELHIRDTRRTHVRSCHRGTTRVSVESGQSPKHHQIVAPGERIAVRIGPVPLHDLDALARPLRGRQVQLGEHLLGAGERMVVRRPSSRTAAARRGRR